MGTLTSALRGDQKARHFFTFSLCFVCCANRHVPHFNPQHWLLRRMGLFKFRVEFLYSSLIQYRQFFLFSLCGYLHKA